MKKESSKISIGNDTESLEKFFTDEGFNVHLSDEDGESCGEIENWTDGGVNMIMVLIPFTKQSFDSYVDSFDIDEQIDNHRVDEAYCRVFTIKGSLRDFKKYLANLKKVRNKLIID